MGEWITCRACQLKHSRRPDGLCPKCKQPLGTGESLGPSAPALHSHATTTAPPVAMELGSLAQSARSSQLASARSILLFVGVLTVIVNGLFFGLAEKNVDEAIQAEIKKLPGGYVADPIKVAEVRREGVRTLRLMNGGGLVLGVIFVLCGLLVRQYPVPSTISGLVLYLGGNAIFMLLDPSTVAKGIIMKVIVIGGLFKAVQAAIAYQKDAASSIDP